MVLKWFFYDCKGPIDGMTGMDGVLRALFSCAIECALPRESVLPVGSTRERDGRKKKSNHSCCCCPVFPALPETLVWCSLLIRLTLSLYRSLSPAWCGMLLRSVSLRIVDFYCPNKAIIRQGGGHGSLRCMNCFCLCLAVNGKGAKIESIIVQTDQWTEIRGAYECYRQKNSSRSGQAESYGVVSNWLASGGGGGKYSAKGRKERERKGKEKIVRKTNR